MLGCDISHGAVTGVLAFDVPAVSYAARQAVPGTGVIIVDPDLRIVHADGPAIDKHGYQTWDWPGRLIRDVLPPR